MDSITRYVVSYFKSIRTLINYLRTIILTKLKNPFIIENRIESKLNNRIKLQLKVNNIVVVVVVFSLRKEMKS